MGGDHNAFSKYLLGWIDPIIISSGTQQVILPPSETTPTGNAVLIMPDAQAESFGEFFLVQYREPGSGNDPLYPGLKKAVWIWHVDSTLTSDGQNFQYDNSYTPHKLLRLMEADGKEQIETGNGLFDVNDFYLPGQAIGPTTVPNTNKYSGLKTNIAVYNIKQLSSSMQMNFSIFVRPVARFTTNINSGYAPQAVKFMDQSTDNPIGWAWYFGDETFTAPWTLVNASAGWSARFYHSSVAMPDGSIVLMGGEGSVGYKNDVWRSTDNGVTWTLMNASAGWSARRGHSSVVMPDGSIVLMGGSDSVRHRNDVWRSTDNGATWTLVNESAGWSVRGFHSSVVMPDGSIVLMGGEGT